MRYYLAAGGGTGCSAMIYIDTRRQFWRASQTVPRLLGTAGIVVLALIVPPLAAITLPLKLCYEGRSVFDRSISARLQRGSLARIAVGRDLLGLLARVS